MANISALSKSAQSFWCDKYKYDDAERVYYEKLSHESDESAKMSESKRSQKTDKRQRHRNRKESDRSGGGNDTAKGHSHMSDVIPQINQKSLVSDDIAKLREHIKVSLESVPSLGSDTLNSRVQKVEEENQTLKKTVANLNDIVKKLESRVAVLEQTKNVTVKTEPPKTAQQKPVKPEVKKEIKKEEPKDDDDDDVDLFGSDDDEEADELRKKRLEEYAAKKSKKPAVIAKSSIVLDVKPWDDETDMQMMETLVRKIQMDGLLWGASKFVPLAYGIKKLQIVMVVEDDKVSVEDISERIESLEDFVQSVDVAAFSKI